MDEAVPPDGGRYSIRAVDRAIDILDVLGRWEGGASLGDIAGAIGLPKSSVFRYLATLEQRGTVVRDENELFRLGASRSFMRPGEVVRLSAIALPRMQEICRRFEETINLGTMDGHRIVYLEVVESPKAMRFAASRGGSDPIHSSALGKAVSATLTEQEIRDILAHEGMPALTPNTITEPSGFIAELDAVRARGYAIDEGENEENGRCVAVSLPLWRPGWAGIF